MARITGVEVTSDDRKIRFRAEFAPEDDVDKETETIAHRADKLTRKIRTAKRMKGKQEKTEAGK